MSSGDLKKVKFVAGSASLRGVNSEPGATFTAVEGGLTPPARLWLGLKPAEVLSMPTVSLAVLMASYRAWWPIGVAEAWGFVTGGICVWLVVREHMWNWPIGLANNIFFFVLFLEGRLFADMSLQVVYFGLGIYGWLNWLFGGENRSVFAKNPKR